MFPRLALRLALFAALGFWLGSSTVSAQFLPLDVGTTLNGVQDDFTTPTLRSNWAVRGSAAYSVNNGRLLVTTVPGDPNHLLYERVAYNSTYQEVLARLRVRNFGTGDSARAGVATAVSSSTSQGINFHFRDEPNPGNRHMEFLDDRRVWGPELPFNWQNNVWYWIRLRHEINAASLGGTNDAFAKIWKADGSEPEPVNWQSTYNYTPARSARTGFAGIAATSDSGTAEFEVDYILIKAAGLPSITVSPGVQNLTPVQITRSPGNITLEEGSPMQLSAEYTGNPEPTFQWFKNSIPIANATNSQLQIPNLNLNDAGRYNLRARNTVSNTVYEAFSDVAVVVISPDRIAPTLVSARSRRADQLEIQFSERVTTLSASRLANYQLLRGTTPITIQSAQLDGSGSNVLLRVAPLSEGVSYTLVVNGIVDAAATPNSLASNTRIDFYPFFFDSTGIGTPVAGAREEAVAGGINLTGGGRDLGGTTDHFLFSHQFRTGDFDVKVRMESISLTHPWSEAGLLAREDLSTGSRFAATLATPSISGCYFQVRTNPAATASLSGAHPVNHPNTWLRLQRVGDEFRGYAGVDGSTWQLLGSSMVTMPASVYLGFALSSHTTNGLATAQFRDFADVTSANPEPRIPTSEPLGQSSRRTSLVISEIHYHPADRADGRNLEFVELFNSMGTPENISGWKLDGAADFVFPEGTILPGGGFLVVAASPADLEAVTGVRALGPFSNANGMPNTRGSIRLRNRIGAVFLEANYDSVPPWPVAADGTGHSLVLARPSYGERNVEAWGLSDRIGGSPGQLDAITLDPVDPVKINELLANSAAGSLDFIELYNHGNTTVDVSNCFLTDAVNTNKFRIPQGTLLAPRSSLAFTATQLGFALSAAGETVYFRNASNTRVIDAIRFEGQALGTSFGRFPDGSDDIQELSSPTPGSPNAAPLTRDLVINEIMYRPLSGNNDEQFLELYNRGSQAIDISGWRMDGGVEFQFPSNTRIAPQGYLVVARNPSLLRANHPHLNNTNTVGPFTGSLAGNGERVAILMRDPVVTIQGTVRTTNYNWVVADEVTWRNGGRWGRWSDGGGSSLELIDPRADNRLAANWADSDETAKASWTTVSVKGVLDNSTATANRLIVLLQGAGECLIDDVEVRNLAGLNVITNSTFESGAGSWTAEGTMAQSGLENAEGYNSSRSYRVRASDRGDNQVNRIRVPLSVSQANNRTNTIQARVRWLKGHPEILFRLIGNGLEAAVRMNVPSQLGTPGARNSRAVTHAPPAIHHVSHYPPVPAVNEPVVVTARAHHPDGLERLELRFRTDPQTNFTTLVMKDDGSGGDAVPGDGVYAATIPGQANNTLIAFHVRATDASNTPTESTFPYDAPVHECLVRFGETVPSGNFPSYRFWMTRAAFNAWDTRNNLNNTLNDVTFVLGNHRVIYNAGAAYAGSPYIGPSFDTPTGRLCGYSIEFPSDDRFLGDTALVLDWPGGHGGENTAIQEQMAYWIADQVGLAFSHRHFIRLTVNGITDMQRGGVFEAALQPSGEFLRQWSPNNTSGDFFKIDRAFEFDDGGSLIADPEPQLRIYRTPDLVNGGFKKKTETYRWFWLKRSFDSANDYTNLFVLADILNAPGPEPYTSQSESMIDIEQWMGIFAVEHIINNFDSWGHDIGKNMYMYKPVDGRWQIYMFDLDWLMLVASGNYPPESGGLFVVDDPTVSRMYSHPPFRRAYFRTIQKAIQRAFDPALYEPVMDARYESLLANGVNRCDGQPLSSPELVKAWFRARRTFLVSQLNPVLAPFAITSNGGNSFTTNSSFGILDGTAPAEAAGLLVNGSNHKVRWTTATNWQVLLPLQNGSNWFQITAADPDGRALTHLTDGIGIISTVTPTSPAGKVVINEIHYSPAIPDTAFLELVNTSSQETLSLGGWTIDGIDLDLPSGTVINPSGFLVLAQNRTAFARIYGGTIPVAAEFGRTLDPQLGTISISRHGPSGEVLEKVDSVTYASDPPWPLAAGGFGPSLQLIDPLSDNTRVANWAAGPAGTPSATPGTTNAFARSLPNFPQVWINELLPANNSGLTDNAGEREPWVELRNTGTTAVNLTGWFLTDDYSNLTRWPFPAGTTLAPGAYLLIWLDGEPTETAPGFPHTSFRAHPTTGSLGLVFPLNEQPTLLDYLNYDLASPDRSFGFSPDDLGGMRVYFDAPTPGASNSITNLPPPLFINEWMAANTQFIPDPADGQFDDWFEIYNPSTREVDLTGYTLTDRPDLVESRKPVPNGTRIPARGYLLVWADEQTAQNTGNTTGIHAHFRLSQSGEAIALFDPQGRLVDSISFRAQTNNISEGRWPDGGADRYFMASPTPGTANIPPTNPNEQIRILSTTLLPDGNLRITWNARPGTTYLVEYRDDLIGNLWTPSGYVLATDATPAAVLSTTAAPSRFYRIQRVEP